MQIGQPLLGQITDVPPALVLIAASWSLFWKGVALWQAARNSQKYWFIALLIINTLGILEIVYLLFFERTKTLRKTLPKFWQKLR